MPDNSAASAAFSVWIENDAIPKLNTALFPTPHRSIAQRTTADDLARISSRTPLKFSTPTQIPSADCRRIRFARMGITKLTGMPMSTNREL